MVRPVDAAHPEHRLAGAPHDAPFRLRVVTREQLRVRPDKTIPIDRLREHIPRDMAADIAALPPQARPTAETRSCRATSR